MRPVVVLGPKEGQGAAAAREERFLHWKKPAPVRTYAAIQVSLPGPGEGALPKSCPRCQRALPLAEERLCNIMAQVCSALGEAHVNDVIHRDLKPENVMVEVRRDQPDHVKVLDFGIAKILGPDVPALARQGIVRLADGDQPGLTRHDVVCGTPQYMAPEQATGSALDERCDLYALGVILYQMATGHLPFDGASSMEVL